MVEAKRNLAYTFVRLKHEILCDITVVDSNSNMDLVTCVESIGTQWKTINTVKYLKNEDMVPCLLMLFIAPAATATAAATVVIIIIAVVIILAVTVVIVVVIIVMVIIVVVIAIAVAIAATAHLCCSHCWLVVVLLSAIRFCHHTPSCDR